MLTSVVGFFSISSLCLNFPLKFENTINSFTVIVTPYLLHIKVEKLLLDFDNVRTHVNFTFIYWHNFINSSSTYGYSQIFHVFLFKRHFLYNLFDTKKPCQPAQQKDDKNIFNISIFLFNNYRKGFSKFENCNSKNTLRKNTSLLISIFCFT